MSAAPSCYNPYGVVARALGNFQNKMGSNCPTFLWNRGNPILFDGTDASWVLTPSMASEKNPLVTGGFGSHFTLKFSVLAAQFYTQPSPLTVDQLRLQLMNTPIGYLGASYRIETVEVAPNGVLLTIEAVALAGGS